MKLVTDNGELSSDCIYLKVMLETSFSVCNEVVFGFRMMVIIEKYEIAANETKCLTVLVKNLNNMNIY